MRENKKNFSLRARIWKYHGPAAWHFVTISKVISKKIRSSYKTSEEGWGRLKTVATLGASSWKTAIWFDSKRSAYLLPIKSSIRKKEKIIAGVVVTITINFENQSQQQ